MANGTVSPELQRRIEQLIPGAGVADAAGNYPMPPSGITQAMASQLKGKISNREMQLFEDAMRTGNVEKASQVFNILNNTKGVLSNREMQLFEDAMRTGNISNLENVMSMLSQLKGKISNREMELFQQLSPGAGVADAAGNYPMLPSGTDVSNREMELLQQLSPGAGAGSDQEMMMMQQAGDDDLGARIQQLMMEMQASDDPDEQKQLGKTIERLQLGAQAPLAGQALAIQGAGTGEDTVLAHLSPGEVVLPPQFLEDPELESMIEKKFMDAGIDPQEAVAGVGIASLNQMTGLEEFGFFKKIGKALKKVAKKIAPIAGPLANFIPGVGPLIAGAIGAATNVIAGKGLKGAISGGLGGFTFGKALGGIGSLSGSAAGSASKFAGQGFGAKLSSLKAGLGSLPGEGFFGKVGEFILPGADDAGLFKNIGKASSYMLGPAREGMIQGTVPSGGLDPNNPPENTYYDPVNDMIIDKATGQQYVPPPDGGFQLSDIWRGTGINDDGKYGFLGDLGGSLAMAGLPAYMLGKMAYDEAKADKGVPLTPLTTMDAGGRYNIEAEIARRTGAAAPNPVEFGLLPEGTIPQLSGGAAGPRQPAVVSRYYRPEEVLQGAHGGLVPAYAYGGLVPAYANGGNVDAREFARMNGKIEGPGSETSDEVPAMLSDGEFVMTGRAVRGAGAFQLNRERNGILTLTPSGSENREQGTKIMYDMMDEFSRRGNAPAFA